MDLCAKEVIYDLAEKLIQQSKWISNVDVFLGWLKSLKFRGGDNNNEAAVAEALAQALQVLIHDSYILCYGCSFLSCLTSFLR